MFLALSSNFFDRSLKVFLSSLSWRVNSSSAVATSGAAFCAAVPRSGSASAGRGVAAITSRNSAASTASGRAAAVDTNPVMTLVLGVNARHSTRVPTHVAPVQFFGDTGVGSVASGNSKMAEYQLYCFAQSGNAYRSALMLNLIGADWEPKWDDFFGKGEQRGPEYRTNVNEMGEVPVLVHGPKK